MSVIPHVVELRGNDGGVEKASHRRDGVIGIKDLGDERGLPHLWSRIGGQGHRASDNASNTAGGGQASERGLVRELKQVVVVVDGRDDDASVGSKAQRSR